VPHTVYEWYIKIFFLQNSLFLVEEAFSEYFTYCFNFFLMCRFNLDALSASFVYLYYVKIEE